LESTLTRSEATHESEGKVLRIIVTIKSELVEKTISGLVNDYEGLTASVTFCENDKPIDDFGIIMKDERFWGLIRYYHKEIFDASSTQQFLLNDTKITQEAEATASQKTNLLVDLTRILLPKLDSKTKSNATTNILFILKYILQKLNVSTSVTVLDQEEITIAKTYLGHTHLTLVDRKFPITLFYLHLANVVLANQLILKPVNDFIAKFERAISLLKSRALPYSIGFFIVNLGLDAWILLHTFDEVQSSMLNLVLYVLPFVWPLLGLCVRKYGSKIVYRILRYAINRILNSANYKNSFMNAFDLSRWSLLLQPSENQSNGS
jgi:hypothetical protein